jgi:copper(I)-binding protein
MLALPLGFADANDYRVGSLVIDHPWAIATPTGAKVGGGYMKITNNGTEPDRLIGLASPAASRLLIHETTKQGDVVKMRVLEKGLEIKPGETIELSPGGTHVMFEGLRAPLIEANRVKGTLVFEKAGMIEIDYAIVPMGTKPAAGDPAAHHNH